MQRVKLDPIAYLLLVAVLAIQVYTTFLDQGEASALLKDNDAIYQTAVFEDEENKGVMHQVFRQNEVNRELVKYLVQRCGR